MKKIIFSSFLALTAFVSQAQIPTSGLVANYSFNNGNADDEAGSNDGIVLNATLTTDRFGNANKAYSFNAGNNIYLGDQPEFQFGTAGSFSISVWAKYTSSQLSYIIAKRNPNNFQQYGILVGNASLSAADNTIRAYMRDNNGHERYMGVGNAYNDNQWHHFVLIHTPDSSVLYIDNVKAEVNTSYVLDDLSIAGHPLVIGASDVQSNNGFGGQIDDVRIYNRALNETEVDMLFKEPNPNACIVHIPDPYFRDYLLGHPSINTNGNYVIECSEANNFQGSIIINNVNISDLTGIEAFTKIPILNIQASSITSLNVSGCTTLNTLSSTQVGSPINSIDVSNCPALQVLNCRSASLTSLDVSNNPLLTRLNLHNNKITSLDVSNNPALTELEVDANNLTMLNVANGYNAHFTYFTASYNPNLTCIQVDNPTWSTANWTVANYGIDEGVTFSTDCGYVSVPATPTNLTATAIANPLSVTLDWTDNATDETGYKIERSTDGITFTEIADEDENTISYTDNTVAENTTYHYRVYAYNTDGDSDFSNVVNTTTGSAPAVSIPATPTNLMATASTTPISVSLAWADNANNEIGYKIERSTDGTTFTEIADVNADVTTYWDTLVAENTTYHYRVYAYSADTISAFSNVAQATTGELGLNTISASTLRVYPNPANNVLNIEVKDISIALNVKIVNVLGATVATQNLNAGTNSIDVSNFTAGVYFVQLSNGGAVKFVKE